MGEHRYTVRGHWPFPTDMLRHDGSRPETPDDQALVERLSQPHATSRGDFDDVDVDLVGPNQPNTARWESFGWVVPTDLDHQVHKRIAEMQRDEQRLIDSAMSKLTDDERAVIETRMSGSR